MPLPSPLIRFLITCVKRILIGVRNEGSSTKVQCGGVSAKLRRLGVFFFTVSLLLLNLWVAPGDPWTPQWSLALSLIPLIIPRPANPDRPPLTIGSCGIYFVPWHRWHGHSVAWCQWQVEARIPACLATASGRRRELERGNLSSGQERQQRAINGSRGNFLESRAPPGALPSQTAVTRRVRALAR